MAHTPGPWSMARDFNEQTGAAHYKVENPTFDGPCPCGGKHPPGRLIAWLAGSLGDARHRPSLWRADAQIEADARLIASAPRLLAALKRAEPILAAYTAAYGICNDDLDAVRTAIAEAEEA